MSLPHVIKSWSVVGLFKRTERCSAPSSWSCKHSYHHLSPGTFAARKSPVEVLKETNWSVRTSKPGKLPWAATWAFQPTFGLRITADVGPPLSRLLKAFMEDDGQLSSANNRLPEQRRWGHGWHGDHSHRSPSGATVLAIHCNEGSLPPHINFCSSKKMFLLYF